VTLGNLGMALVEVRRFEEAISAHRGAAAICRETGDRHREGVTLGNLGMALVEVRRFEEAVECWREAAAAMRDAGDREAAGRLEQLAANSRPRRRWGLRRGSSS
jgi:hypothetical protein